MIQNGQFGGLTEAQVAERRGGIGGSDAADIMAGNWADLWAVKTGRKEETPLWDKLSGTLDYFVLKYYTRERMELSRLMGHVTEDLNCFWYEQQTGRAVTRRRERVASEQLPFMVANLDGVTTTRAGLPCYWDAKHVNQLNEATMLRLTPQGVHNATILGLDWWGLSVLIGSNKWEWVEQECDPLYQATLIAKEREFWGYVERDEEPPDMLQKVLAPKPQPKLRTLLFDTMPEAERPNWYGDFLKFASVFAGTEAAAKKHAIARKDLAALIPEGVGLVRHGLFEAKRDGRGLTLALKKGNDDA